MSTTRLGQSGVGVKAYGVFTSKSAGPHNPGIITRLTLCGVMGAKYGVFEPKGGDVAVIINEWLIRARRRGRR